jgi:hypothetical protein
VSALIILVVLLGLVVVVVAGVTLWLQPIHDELTRRRIERLRLQRAQLEAERRIHRLVGQAFTDLLEEARRQRQP